MGEKSVRVRITDEIYAVETSITKLFLALWCIRLHIIFLTNIMRRAGIRNVRDVHIAQSFAIVDREGKSIYSTL